MFSLTIHEMSHALAADWCGDPTARLLGRVSLNPMVHLDAVGSVFLPLILAMSPGGFVFGWAKPVPVNTGNLKNGRRDFWIVAVAGPASNLVLAVGASLLLGAIPNQIGSSEVTQAEPLTDGLGLLVRLNLLLALFNMLPVPPLDGSTVLGAFVPAYRRWMDSLGSPMFLFFILFIVLMNAPFEYHPFGVAIRTSSHFIAMFGPDVHNFFIELLTTIFPWFK